jgi:biofilm PGA synthesis N-glycosyltransferase PgaC
MVNILFFIAIFGFSLFGIVYLLYFLFVLRNPKKEEYLKLIENAFKKELSLRQLPIVSILVPAYNEEEVISRKLQNISTLDYPHEKIEVILIDDCSTDKTAHVAQQGFDKLGLQGKVIRNGRRLGVNACYNIAVAESKGDLVLTTDADVTIENDALMKGVKIFESLENVGGITGKMIPLSNGLTPAVLIEKTYRSLYDASSTTESAIHSAFPGYTCFTLLKKSAFSQLPLHYGSSDGNISLAIIKKGLRFLSVPGIFFYEPVSIKLNEQRRQKIRRAARMIQSILANKNMMFKDDYGSFGKIIFPLRFAMMIISPLLFFLGFAATVLATMYVSTSLGLLFTLTFLSCVYLGTKTSVRKLTLFSSLVVHQFYLLLGLFSSQKRMTVWRPVERSSMHFEGRR